MPPSASHTMHIEDKHKKGQWGVKSSEMMHIGIVKIMYRSLAFDMETF